MGGSTLFVRSVDPTYRKIGKTDVNVFLAQDRSETFGSFSVFSTVDWVLNVSLLQISTGQSPPLSVPRVYVGVCRLRLTTCPGFRPHTSRAPDLIQTDRNSSSRYDTSSRRRVRSGEPGGLESYPFLRFQVSGLGVTCRCLGPDLGLGCGRF